MIPDDDSSSEGWTTLVVARTSCNWSAVDRSALLQLANPSDKNLAVPANTFVGCIQPIVSSRTSHVNSVSSTPAIDFPSVNVLEALRAALQKSFSNTTFTSEKQKSPLSNKNERSIYAPSMIRFSLSPQGLGTCNLATAEFPLEPGTRPADRASYRTTPRAQEVIDNMCFPDGIQRHY